MRGRFDPIEGDAYGECVTCGLALATEADARAHRTETMPTGGRSHSTRGMNPPRNDRIQRFVDNEVEDAISGALDGLREAVDRGDLSGEEVAQALVWHSDFADAWANSGES